MKLLDKRKKRKYVDRIQVYPSKNIKNMQYYIYMDSAVSDDLLNALENETNSPIMNLTTRKIKEHKNTALQQLQIKGSTLKKFHKKLKGYRYVRGMHDLQFGYYIRWIPLKDPEKIYLTNGGHICDIKIINKQIQILCKNSCHRLFQIKFDESVIFQRITPQEAVILQILDYLDPT